MKGEGGLVIYEVEEGRVESEGGCGCGEEEDLERLAPEAAQVEERRLLLTLLLILHLEDRGQRSE